MQVVWNDENLSDESLVSIMHEQGLPFRRLCEGICYMLYRMLFVHDGLLLHANIIYSSPPDFHREYDTGEMLNRNQECENPTCAAHLSYTSTAYNSSLLCWRFWRCRSFGRRCLGFRWRLVLRGFSLRSLGGFRLRL